MQSFASPNVARHVKRRLCGDWSDGSFLLSSEGTTRCSIKRVEQYCIEALFTTSTVQNMSSVKTRGVAPDKAPCSRFWCLKKVTLSSFSKQNPVVETGFLEWLFPHAKCASSAQKLKISWFERMEFDGEVAVVVRGGYVVCPLVAALKLPGCHFRPLSLPACTFHPERWTKITENIPGEKVPETA